MMLSAWEFESESPSLINFSRQSCLENSDLDGSLTLNKNNGQLICKIQKEQVLVVVKDNLQGLGDDIVGVTKKGVNWVANRYGYIFNMLRLRNGEISSEQNELLTGVVSAFGETIKREQWKDALRKIEELWNLMKAFDNYFYIDICYKYQDYCNAKLLNEKAIRLFNKKDFGGANKLYEQTIQLCPPCFLMANFEGSLNSLISQEEEQNNHSNARGLRRRLTEFFKKVTGGIESSKLAEHQSEDALSYYKEKKYKKALRMCNDLLNANPNNSKALEIKLICLYKGIIEKSDGIEKGEIKDDEWKRIIRTIQNQTQNEYLYGHLAKLVYHYVSTDSSRMISRYVLSVYHLLVNHTDGYRSLLFELLAKDSEKNEANEYSTAISEFCSRELERLKGSPSPDRPNILKVVSNISKKGVKFERATCAHIEELLFGKEEESALNCLCNLIKSSKYSVDDKVVSYLCETMSKDLISNTMRLTAFHSIVNSICHAHLEFSKKVNKAFYQAIEDNSEKMTKLVIQGISKLESKNINYAMIQKLCDLRTYNDEQLLRLLKVIRDFVKDNYMNYPDEVLKLCVNESSNNPNQNIRIDALNILKQIKDKGGDLPDNVANHIDFECNLQKLKKSTDTKEITKILKSLLKMDFKSTSISFSTLDTVAYLFSSKDSDVYVKYILRFISRVIAENIPVTHQFIDEVIKYCLNSQDNQECIKIIKDLIHKYDQYCNSDILQNALKCIKESTTEENKKMWIQILVDLSNRNVKFTSEYLIDLLNCTSDDEDILFDVIKNAVGNIDKISESLIERLEDMLISETHQTKVLEIFVQTTRSGVLLKDDIILLLLNISQSDSDNRKYIYEIFVNLSKNNCKLPEAATHLGEFISQINIIKNKDQSLAKINEAVVKIVEIDNISDLSPFISYESLLMHLENLIKDHKNSQLSLICMKSIDYFCQKNPSLLGHLNWNLISSCVKYSEFNKVLFKLFGKGANSKVKFPRGALSKLAESENKDQVIGLLQKVNKYSKFSKEDKICKQIINVATCTEIKTEDQLKDFIDNEEVSAEGQPLNTLIKSLKNEDVKIPIMNFLKKMMINKCDLSSVIKQYIKNIPDRDHHLFIGPLIVFQILKDSYIQEIDKKLVQILESNDFKQVCDAVGLIKLGIYHETRFDAAVNKCIEIVGDNSVQTKIRVEAASVFPHFYESNPKILIKMLTKTLLKVIPEDKNIPDIDGAPPIEKLQRFCILFRNKCQLDLVDKDSNWEDVCKQCLISIIIKRLYPKNSMGADCFIKNIKDFEKKNNIKGFSVFRDYALESLIWIINNNKNTSPNQIKNILNICKDIDSKTIIDQRYICIREDYVQFLIETWLKTFVMSIECLNLKSNKKIEVLTAKMIKLDWSSYFIQLLFNKIIESNQECNVFEIVEFCEKYGISEVCILDVTNNLESYRMIHETSDQSGFMKSLIFKLSVLVVLSFIQSTFEGTYKFEKLDSVGKKLSKLLLNEEWNISKVLELIELFKDKNCKFEEFDKAVDSILSYNITPSTESNSMTLNSILSEKNPKEWETCLHKLGIDTTFVSPKEQGLEELIELIVKMNPDNKDILSYVERLKSDVLKIKDMKSSKIIKSKSLISEWNKDDILNWCGKFKQTEGNKKSSGVREAIAVIMKGNQIHNGYLPRFTQIITVLIMMNAADNGLFLQVATGEGKSLIIAMLAILKCLLGHTVDIVTSADHLAERDAKEMKQFYSIFGLTCTSNKEMSNGTKECYSKNIVYGSPGAFQGDLLRHEFELQNTKGDRKYDTVIVDEVDNMLIDDARHITMLSGPMPGFEHLLSLLLCCWNIFKQIDQNFIIKDDKLYWTNEDVFDKDGKILLRKQSVRGNLFIVYNRLKFGSNLVTEALRAIIKEEQLDDDKKIEFPQYLKEFALGQSCSWVESAYKAEYEYKEKVNYTIEDKDGSRNIFPVDFASTGSIQKNMVLSNGLHQFLQIKHGLRLTAENLITSSISNLEYFKRYENNIYGLTGTIGPKESQNFLNTEYKINVGFIPSFKKKQLKEVPIIINKNYNKWLNKVCSVAISEANKHRAVLIVNETIEIALHIKNRLLELKLPRKNLIICTGTDKENIPQTVDSDTIIVSTNLAGRGTDINTTENVEVNGGLHVIVTFLPRNQRIQEQAFGRSARKGKKGTCQLILNQDEVQRQLGRLISDDSDILKLRDDLEINRLAEVKTKDLNETFIQDEIFKKFSKYITKDPECTKDSNYKKSNVEKWAIFRKKYEQNKKSQREEIKPILQNKCYDNGVKAYDISNKENSFYGAVHPQLETVPKHKNKTVTNIKEETIIGAIRNPKFCKVKTEEEKKQFAKDYADCSKWKDNKLIESFASQTNSNVAIIDLENEEPEIIKTSNNPDATIYLARQDGKYFPCRHEDESNTKINSKILKAPINCFSSANKSEERKGKQAQFKKARNVEEEKNKAAPIIREMEQIQYEQSQVKKKQELKNLEENFNKFREECNQGVTISNPVHSTNQGNQLVREEKYNEANSKYDQAIHEDPIYSVPARYNKAISIVMGNREKGLDAAQKQDAIDSLKKAKKIIDNNLISQAKATLVQYGASSGAKNLSEIEDSDMAKQITGKISVYDTIKKNIDENIDTIRKYDSKQEDLGIGANQTLSTIFEDNKDQKDAAEEIERSGLPELKKVVATEKPKKKQGFWHKLLMVGVGIAQVVLGGYLATLTGGMASFFSGPLIRSGLNDIFTGIESMISNEDISWKEWGITKVGMISGCALTIGMKKISDIVNNTKENTFKGAIARGLFNFLEDKSKEKFNFADLLLQKDKKNGKNALSEEAKNRIDKSNSVILNECERMIKKSGLNDTATLDQKYSGAIQSIVKYMRQTFDKNTKLPKNLVMQITQMIIYDKLNSTNGTISIFDSKVNHSVSQNSNIQTQIEKIVSNIYSVLNDKDTQDAACKLLEDNKVNKFFEEYKIQPLMIGFISLVPKSLNEISESICKQMSPLSQMMMNECRLTEKEANACMKVFVKEKVVDPHYPYIINNISKIDSLKCSPEEKAIVDKCKEFLSKTATISSQLTQDQSKAEDKAKGVIYRYYDRLIERLSKKLEDFSFESDPEFKSNRDKQFEKAKNKIQMKLKTQDGEDDEYVPVDIHKEENMKQQKHSKAYKELNKKIAENPIGKISDLSNLSKALSTPIQMVKDGHFYETFGDNFPGNPIVAILNSNSKGELKWKDNNGVEADSIYHLVANSINKSYDDIVEMCSKYQAMSRQSCSNNKNLT